MTDPNIASLWQRFFLGKLNPEEKEMLARWIEEAKQEEDIKALLETSWINFKPDERLPKEKADRMLASILDRARIKESTNALTIHRKHTMWKRLAVAASIVLLAGCVSYFLIFTSGPEQQKIVQQSVPADIAAPAINRATVTLGNGQRIYLDSAANGTLISIGNVKLVKLDDGKIAYDGVATEIIHNTLTNPRASKVIDMMLSDGSHVWLNAGSSVTYPIVFTGQERKVSVNGEAYFEVTHNNAMPFKVSKGSMEVTVLGTHFNVLAYDGQKDMRVTLLEGSVKVSNGNSEGVLKPGQQAKVAGPVEIVNEVDLEAVMAWKNGYFKFSATDLPAIAQQLNHWYDAEIVYKGNMPDKKVTGYIPRHVSISKVLEMLEYTAGVKYTITGNKVILK